MIRWSSRHEAVGGVECKGGVGDGREPAGEGKNSGTQGSGTNLGSDRVNSPPILDPIHGEMYV